MGKRDLPSIENLDNWVSHRDALRAMLIRLDDMQLVFAEFNMIKPRRMMWAELVDDPPRIHRRLLAHGEAVVLGGMPPLNRWSRDACRHLLEGDYRITYKLNGKKGWLYLWKPDLEKYFPKAVVAPTQEATPKPKPVVVMKGSYKPEWVWQVVEALRLHLETPGDLPYAIYEKLDDLIDEFGATSPGQSRLIELVGQAVSY